MKDLNSAESGLIYETLLKHYGLEIKKIQMLQAQDVAKYGSISDKTNKMLDELLERVVEDNKRLGRT